MRQHLARLTSRTCASFSCSEFLHKFLPDELSRRYYAEALRRCEALKNAADPIEYERVHYFNAI